MGEIFPDESAPARDDECLFEAHTIWPERTGGAALNPVYNPVRPWAGGIVDFSALFLDIPLFSLRYS